MIVHFTLEAECPNDGQPLFAHMTSNVRVNLSNLKTDSKNLIFTRSCSECGDRPDLTDPLWRLDPESAAKVEAAREKIRSRRKKAA